MKMRFLCLIALPIVVSCGSSSAVQRQLNIGGQNVTYTFYSCAPAIKYDGTTIKVEGLEVPTGTAAVNKAVNFKIGKVEATPTVRREISDYTQRYKMLLDETCKTMVLIPKDRVEAYATHRDTLMAQFIAAAGKLEGATTEQEVGQITKAASDQATALGSKPSGQ